ncbi:MAG: GHKL domain-containing protein [Proteobacteria bacterium]|nr:GHKL domain-containing protein [Pseudomonadota bacterium]MBU4470678.1 GHKL domain-containing protein [Pseudomonadota bacterium]MCG2751227.1 ATP-binding protein [Desulfobacteraceae bacterium]
MAFHSKAGTTDLNLKLKWLIAGRFLFGVLLMGSTITLQLARGAFPTPESFRFLYLIIAAIWACSFFYYLIFRFHRHTENPFPAYFQMIFDTLLFTLIIHVTGGYLSVFSFLYLVLVMIASILLFKKGSLIIAGICTLEYWVVMQAENTGLLKPVFMWEQPGNMVYYSAEQILYKALMTGTACFAVAFLSGFLSEQARKSRAELLEMEVHVKRVEKMAYMGQMAANLAHEIKNPLASLAGSIQLLREEIPYKPGRDRLMQIILRETDRLSVLATNFLFFARPPAGKQENILLDKAIKDIITLFEKDHSLNDRIEVITELAEGIWVRMDPMQLNQILFNLLLNAAEAIEGEGVIRVKMLSSKNDNITMEIHDNGKGIPEEILNMIFDPFFTTKTKGSGLGLSIVHNILETYGSRLSVESRVNKGTTFRFSLKKH